MINRVQLNNQKPQTGFGMSKFKNLKAIAVHEQITEEGAKKAKDFMDNAANDGNNIILDLQSSSFKDQLGAYVKHDKGSLFKNLFSSTVYVVVKDVNDNTIKQKLQELVCEGVEKLKPKPVEVIAAEEAKRKILEG